MIRSGMQRKSRKCKICKNPFTPRSMTHKVCSAECSEILIKRDKVKEENKQIKDAKERMKTIGQLAKSTEKCCNAYIRERDRSYNCISCGMWSEEWNAGHYISVGACRTLRFNEDNIHRQCVHCNLYKHGNQQQYRMRLIAKIGKERVEALEAWHPANKWTATKLIELEAYFKNKLKELKNANKQTGDTIPPNV